MSSETIKIFYSLSLKPHKFLQTMILGLVLLLLGCQKEADFTTGGVTGFIKAIDKYAQFCEDMSGVKVTIANCSGYTNSEGKYQIGNIPIGTHTLKFTKPGYASDSCRLAITPGKIPVFNPKMVFLSEKPDVKITGMDISFVKDKIILKGTLSQSYSVARFFVFINYTPDVSYNNYTLEGSDFYSWIYQDNSYGSITDMTYHGDFEKVVYVEGITEYISKNSTYVAIYIANPFYNYNKENSLINAWPVTKVN
jgi:hypothetical protein